jgi:uncharacterized protein YndB with AHSA1/START domain
MKKVIFWLLLTGVIIGSVNIMVPSEYKISKSLIINAPSERVFSYISNLKNWEQWSPLNQRDGSLKNTYLGPSDGIGAVMNWTSDNSGRGSLIVTELSQNQQVSYFQKVIDTGEVAKGELKLNAEGDQTSVVWEVRGQNTFLGKFVWMFSRMSSKLDQDFELGLVTLKKLAEN